jgi:DNA modification methylase
MKLNIIYNEDCIDGINKIQNETIDLVIADPPYFKVINEKWDYKWKTEEDYINWSIKWINQINNKLRKGGTFYIFGYFNILAKLYPIIENMGFDLKEVIIINKGIKAVSGRATKKYKLFPNVTEFILFFVKDSKPFVRSLLKERQKIMDLSAREINEALGVKFNGGGMWSIYTGKNISEQLPTREFWDKLQKILDFDFDYNKINQTFNQIPGYTNVWDDIDFYGEKRYHPTQKPLKMIERLILSSSNEGDIVLDPFMGSGSTALVSRQNNRNYIGFEIEPEYFEKSQNRLKEE